MYIWQHPALMAREEEYWERRNNTTLYMVSVFLTMEENTSSWESETSVRFSTELHIQFWCTECGEDCGSSEDRASGSACTPLLQREWRQQERTPPGQRSMRLIQLLFEAIDQYLMFLSPAESLWQLVPYQMPPGTGGKVREARLWGTAKAKLSKFVDSFNNR